MGLFGQTTGGDSSSPLLPFYQVAAHTATAGPSAFISNRKCGRLIPRCLLLLFLLFFLMLFSSTFLYLPDISSKVQSVGKDFLVPDAGGQSHQIRRPRNQLPMPGHDHAATGNEGRIEGVLDGKVHPADENRGGEEGVKPLDGPVSTSTAAVSDVETKRRQKQIVKMMKHAWDNYVAYAWGSNELRPISKRGHNPSIFGRAKFGATIVDAADTLYLMGLMDEFKAARDWIASNLNVSQSDGEVSVFEFNIRYIGGLLSAYALSKDKMFLDKADEMANAVLPAFDTPTGIPYAVIDLKSKKSKNYGWASGSASILSEIGSLHLEWAYLSKMTGKTVYREKIDRIRNHLANIDKPKGLYPNYINPQTGKWGQVHVSMGALGDSFYEYLFKAWLWSGKTDSQAKEMYDTAMMNVELQMLKTSKGGLKYFGEYTNGRIEHKMDHLACFVGGLYGLSAPYAKDPDHYNMMGREITRTCHESYRKTATKLGPEAMRFADNVEAEGTRPNDKSYLLRPETFESYFVMWRMTKDPKYREWGWEAAQAIETYCRADFGYSGVKDVYQESPIPDDVQQSYFLAETLKYLYLLFSDDDVLSLDKWVLNTEAHPLPVQNPA
ncbi:Mannosyl-oligosaccharide alpha-1,2-mannosidase IA [Hypsibius exemplaris]|uniref:alpha-1,2-Mannosidase n=1 Tax=Hypsibius exemplaris TaxID=2072580 RepID=A0A1W0X932_HYPEX|nr:Mannosyl-oligosaccharide alpha-1,2-mannosidase IA [Hypsibius exemplaris]